MKRCFSASNLDFPSNSGQITAVKQKSEKHFSNIGLKMSMGRSPTKIFSVPELFYQEF